MIPKRSARRARIPSQMFGLGHLNETLNKNENKQNWEQTFSHKIRFLPGEESKTFRIISPNRPFVGFSYWRWPWPPIVTALEAIASKIVASHRRACGRGRRCAGNHKPYPGVAGQEYPGSIGFHSKNPGEHCIFTDCWIYFWICWFSFVCFTLFPLFCIS